MRQLRDNTLLAPLPSIPGSRRIRTSGSDRTSVLLFVVTLFGPCSTAFAFFLLATWPDSFAVNFDWFIFSNALKKLVSAFALDTLFPARLSHIFCSGRHSYNICSASRGFRRSSLNLFRFFLGRLGCLINSTFQNIIYFIYFSHAISTVVYITNSQWPALHLAWFTS